MINLENRLIQGNFFKLIIGLGNTSVDDIKKLSAIYCHTDIDMFDISADKQALEALVEGIQSQNKNPEDYFYCLSFSFGEDIHGSKAKINQQLCTKCGKCAEICPHNAITPDITIISEKCIGCKKCSECNSIIFYKQIIDPTEKLFELNNYKIDMIELHVNGLSANEVKDIVLKIKKSFPNLTIGICLTREKQNDEKIFEIIKTAQEAIYPQKLIFQADGKAMSGTTDELYSSKKAVDFAKILESFDILTIISGGCNSKSRELAELSGAKISGIALGSFARILVSDYMKNSQFWCNISLISEAVQKANCLVQKIVRKKK